MKEDPALLVLAAGMGSRYGGLKQMDAMGPSGEWLLEYSVHDARSAGFHEVVFVVRASFAEEFSAALRQRLPADVRWRVVHQEMDRLPPGAKVPESRTKPLGTGHAIWCASKAMERPFAVINADDFYGRQALCLLADWLRTAVKPDHHAMVAYALERTLSPHGSVSRGLCEIENGFLRSVRELTGIHEAADGTVFGEDAGGHRRTLEKDAPVSMNLWGFHPHIFAELEAQLVEFLGSMENPEKDEFYIPAAVDHLIAEGRARVAALHTAAEWFGVTYAEDRPRVRDGIRGLVRKGDYPENLWSQQ